VPGLIAVGIYTFMISWNEYLFALTLTRTDDMRTVPIGIQLLMGQHSYEWNQMMAMSILGSIPAVANEHSFAVPAFNISDWAMFQGIVEISEETNAPLIVAIHPDEVKHIGRDMITGIIARSHRASVPIAIHWDHGATYDEVLTAIKYGFTSV